MMKKLIVLAVLAVAVVVQVFCLSFGNRRMEEAVIANSVPEKLYCRATGEEDEYVRSLTEKLLTAIRKDGPAAVMSHASKVSAENRDQTVATLEALRDAEQVPVVDCVWRNRGNSSERYWIAECRWQGRRLFFNYVPDQRCLKLAAAY